MNIHCVMCLSVDALYFLALMRLYGLGVAQDEMRAAELFRRAAEKGHKEAESAMGMLLYHGQGE